MLARPLRVCLDGWAVLERLCHCIFVLAARMIANATGELFMVGNHAVWKTTCQGGLASWQVQLARRLLLSDPDARHSVKQVATHCGLSRSHFEKAFKVSVGTPPHRWRVRQRIQRAQEMLEHTNGSIGLIALRCGFADQSHLTRVFSAIVGSSPAAWRRTHKIWVASP